MMRRLHPGSADAPSSEESSRVCSASDDLRGACRRSVDELAAHGVGDLPSGPALLVHPDYPSTGMRTTCSS